MEFKATINLEMEVIADNVSMAEKLIIETLVNSKLFFMNKDGIVRLKHIEPVKITEVID